MQTNESQDITPTEQVEVGEDANMLFRVCGAQLLSMTELRKDRNSSKSKHKLYAMQLIRLPKEEQGKHFPESILAVCAKGDFPKAISHTIFAKVSGVRRMQSLWSKDV